MNQPNEKPNLSKPKADPKPASEPSPPPSNQSKASPPPNQPNPDQSGAGQASSASSHSDAPSGAAEGERNRLSLAFADEPEGAFGGDGPSDDFMSEPEFFGLFCTPFQTARTTIAVKEGIDLKSLNVTRETAGALEASNGLLKCLKQTPALHFLIDKRTSFYAALAGVVGFTASVGMQAREEYRAAKADALGGKAAA